MGKKYYMSSAQTRLYAMNLIQGPNITYNIPIMLKIHGHVDLERLEMTLNKLVDRHEVFRTYFANQGNKFYQIVEDTVKMKIIYEKRKTVDIHMLFNEFVKPFDLGKPPLIRCFFIETNETNILLLDIHHIIFDGGCVSTLLKDIQDIYNGKCLEPIKVQYKDFSAWQNKKDVSKQRAYWLKQFKDGIPTLSLTFDYKRPQCQNYKGKTIKISLDNTFYESMKTLCRKEGVTEYVVFLSALMILISRYSGQNNIVIGTPVSGRTHPQVQNMMGMFVNILALMGEVDENKSFREFLQEMKEKCFSALDNQEYPFEKLIEDLEIKSNSARNPLFDIMFTVQNSCVTRMALGEAVLETIDFEHNIAKFDLTVTGIIHNDFYDIIVDYNTSLFKEESVKLMFQHYKTLLRNILKEPEKSIVEQTILEQNEVETVIDKFNNTKKPYPSQMSVEQIFKKQVQKFPKKVAIKNKNGSYTYQELDEYSNRIAYKLTEKGVKKGEMVAIMADKNLETIIGILGIIKAGAAYVPIDIKYPLNRIRYILNDTKSKFLLISDKKWNNIIDDKGILLNIREEKEIPMPTFNAPRNEPDSLIYVIYTSGTTGKPKGVMVNHTNIVCLVKNAGYINFDSHLSILQTGSIAFDASTFEIWGALLNGGSVYIAESELLTNVEDLQTTICEEKINTMFVTTALFNQLVDTEPRVFERLENLLFGGEATSEKHVLKFMNMGFDVNLINVYGPTETTTFATYYPIKNADVGCKLPIGKPINNTEIYIVNKEHLCGLGIVGEICIGGPRVARGYLNKDNITNEKFVKNNFSSSNILYKTGDLARWLPDGNIEYIGRIDQQVKIRGFRIELSEIENQIRKCAGIKDVAVIVKVINEDKYICAYYASNNVNEIELKNVLSQNLPDYMLPSLYILLNEIPLTKNGKIDKSALPEPEFISNKTYIQPTNALEQLIVDIFSEILHVEKVGIDDDFYNLGGNSIKAIQIVSCLKEHGYSVMPRSLMQAKTARIMAKEIRDAMDKKVEIDLKEDKDKYEKIKDYVEKTFEGLFLYKNVTVSDGNYKLFFVLPWNAMIRKKILDEVIKNYGKNYIPDYILPYQCNDSNILADKCSIHDIIELAIESKEVPDGEIGEYISHEDEIISSYHATNIQEYYLRMMPFDVIQQDIEVEGYYSEKEVINAVEKVIINQQVPHMSYSIEENKFIIYEHKMDKNKIRFFDLAYSSKKTKKQIRNHINQIFNWRYKQEGVNSLFKIFIIKKSEKRFTISIRVSHGVWDETSMHIFREQFEEALKTGRIDKKIETISDYIYEANSNNINSSKVSSMLERYIGKIKEFSAYNSEKKLIAMDAVLVKMGNAVYSRYRNNPWSIMLQIFRKILELNNLLPSNKLTIPLFILQENRRYMQKQYSNTLGALLDILPIIYEPQSEEIYNHILYLQNVKKDTHIIYADILKLMWPDIDFTEIPSINYHGLYESSYEELEKMKMLYKSSWSKFQSIMAELNMRKLLEINFHTYNEYMMISFPVYDTMIKDLGKEICMRIEGLEKM